MCVVNSNCKNELCALTYLYAKMNATLLSCYQSFVTVKRKRFLAIHLNNYVTLKYKKAHQNLAGPWQIFGSTN